MIEEDKQVNNSTEGEVISPDGSSSTAMNSNGEGSNPVGDSRAANELESPIEADSDTMQEVVSFDSLKLESDSNLENERIPEINPQLEALNQKVQELEAQLRQKTDQCEQYLRVAADFENFRKRTQKEKEELEQTVKCATVLEILPVVDNFERAKDQLKPQAEEAIKIHKDYQGIYKQLVESLKRIGVSPMRAEGQEFDPTLHDAMLREQTDQYPEGVVMAELQRGYLLGDRVLRHAMVKVAATPEFVVPSENVNLHEDINTDES